MRFTFLGYAVVFFSFLAGFFLCALLASGKIADLEKMIWHLRRQLEK